MVSLVPKSGWWLSDSGMYDSCPCWKVLLKWRLLFRCTAVSSLYFWTTPVWSCRSPTSSVSAMENVSLHGPYKVLYRQQAPWISWDQRDSDIVWLRMAHVLLVFLKRKATNMLLYYRRGLVKTATCILLIWSLHTRSWLYMVGIVGWVCKNIYQSSFVGE